MILTAIWLPEVDKALDGNSMTEDVGTPTQEMVESYEYADGSGFPDWSTWHTQKEQRQLLHTINLNHASKQTILYNGAMWKGRNDRILCQWY